jgi:hypothetical protein
METRVRGLFSSVGHSIPKILRIMPDNTICSHERIEKVRVLVEAIEAVGLEQIIVYS